jgi:hypothetical protein
VVTGAKLIAVNGLAYDPDRLRKTITDAKTSRRPIELLVRRGDRFLTVEVPYADGLRWPWLEPVAARAAAPLDLLLAPRRGPIAR